jgi:hypothetical protein
MKPQVSTVIKINTVISWLITQFGLLQAKIWGQQVSPKLWKSRHVLFKAKSITIKIFSTIPLKLEM